ncbi:cell division protein ZapA [Methylocella tundrae]|jgi:cell division protein ZapA|uniref:Cell division protein ZapA n=1 Tax=Methylocella tundrae TaxID=227605 RepID=A0A4U8Z544_METTU|nr:cell division protein ZapA [Methylocella tundrae]WPP04311.1 cell division protein ZapA [Methylocella tundrae]VFU10642.1 Cell division protein ZapA [Methylocella tundrae]
MAQVAMTIAGRVYRVACDEGEEAHLDELAKKVDGQISVMREKFGEMGDQRLTVMAAVTIADELFESNRRVGELEAELSQLKDHVAGALSGREAWIDGVALSLDETASRIEALAQELNGAVRGED